MNIDKSTLPPNARRWLDRSLDADISIPRRILNTQEGEMDVRGTWIPFTAETIYHAEPFSFLWVAKLRPMTGVWITAEDGHDGMNGWGASKLWGFLPMGGRRGPDVFEMQVVRSLAELPWMPQYALALPDLEWNDKGSSQFELSARTGKTTISVVFDLNRDEEIVCASSKRKYDVPDGFQEAPWHYTFSDYRDHEEMHFPGTASAVYEKPDGVWEYWRGKITSITSDS